MLVIRAEQFKSFEPYLLDRYIDHCASYIREWQPEASARYPGEGELREFAAGCIKRGKKFGFKDRGHLRKMLDWECRFGEAFYEQPKWEWMKLILESDLDPANKLHRIENRILFLRERGDL